jgi:molecular chaperone GrpE
MSDAASPIKPPDALESPQSGALSTEEIERVLADFRGWLLDFATVGDLVEPPAQTVDLHTLAGHFIALRQEVNLATRATRSTLEQNADAIAQFAALARRSATPSEPRADSSTDETVRPLLKALIDVYDAITLARKQVERLRDSIGVALDKLVESPPSEGLATRKARRGFFGRLFGVFVPETGEEPKAVERNRLAGETVAYVRQALDSLVAGYMMGLNRIEGILPSAGLEPIAATGQRFDPESMEVIEVVAETNQPEGEVVEEVRRGYRWRGRVFRCAQVRVAR